MVIPHTETSETNNDNYVKNGNQNNDILYLTRADAPHSFRSKLKPFKRHQDFITFKQILLLNFQN